MAGRVSPFWWILRFRLRALGRALGRHAFTVLVIGPMIVVGFALILEPSVERAAGWLRGAAAGWTHGDFAAAGLLAAAALIVGGLASALREVFAIRTPEEALDALPVSSAVRFHLALGMQLVRNAPVFLLLWAALSTAAGGEVAITAFLFAAVEATLAQLLAALLLVRAGWLRRGPLATLGALLAATAWAAARPGGEFLVWALPPAAALEDVFAQALGVAAEVHSGWTAALTIAGLYGLSWAAYAQWRDEDREKAQASTQRRRLLAAWRGLAERRFGRAIGALVLRDLRLTLRGFSPAVYVAGAAALLFELGALSAWLEGWLAPQWIGPFLLFCLSLACLSLSALAPLLLEHELPRMWMERSTGVAPTAQWKAKNRLALILSAPALAVTVALAFAIEPTALDAAALAGRAFLVWVTVATVIGTLAFDIAPSPVLGLLLGGVFAVGLSGLYALQDFWPIGLFLYAYVMHALSERADATAAVLGVES